MNVTPKQASRFWTFVVKAGGDDCWLWTGASLGYGYGCFKIGSMRDGSRQNTGAHRVAFELSHGPVPNGAVIMHSCDVKKCCNPKHLSAGTHSENHKDAWGKNLRRGPKLSREQAARIKESDGPQNAIAKHYGVSCTLVSAIKLGKRWGDQPKVQGAL